MSYKPTIWVQKEIKPDLRLSIDEFNGCDFAKQGLKSVLLISLEESVCSVWNCNKNNSNYGMMGQFAFREHKDEIQYFNGNGWVTFHESAQNEYQMNKADDILLGGNNGSK